MSTRAYSPYSPQVLGDTWVPILEDGYPLTPDHEQGYWFNLSAASTIVTARTYVQDLVQASAENIPLINIYPENGLDWGTVKQLTIPAMNATVYDPGDTITVSGASSVASALYAPVGGFVRVTSASTTVIGCYITFNSLAFTSQLSGKRILKMEFLWSATWLNSSTPGTSLIDAHYEIPGAGFPGFGGFLGTLDPQYQAITGNPIVGSNVFPATTPMYNAVTVSTSDQYPWNSTSIGRFDSTTTASQRLAVTLVLSNTEGVAVNDHFFVYYAALRVTYCDETRVGVGARIASNTTPQFGWGPIGSNFSIPILDSALSAAPALSAGNYYVTVNEAAYDSAHEQPLRALRQLYPQQEPGIQGVAIPISYTPGLAPSAPESTNHIPVISLHTSSATVDDSHGYGQQVGVPVYASNVARQGIVNAAQTGSTSYSFARFYARRVGDTSSPLGLRVEGTTSPAQYITVGEFDALDEIGNGWKQVDLEFTSPLTFNTSGSSSLEFFSNTASGDRWEVLSARATNVTGYNFVEAGGTQWLPPTTYGGTTQYATYDQGSGTPTADVRDDITLMFATMPQVTDLAVGSASLDLDVVTECDQVPGAIPTSLEYNALRWSGMSGGIMADTFDRVAVSGGWGTSTSNAAWSAVIGAASAWSTNGTQGVITPAATSTTYMSVGDVTMLNATIQAQVSLPSVPATQSNIYLVARYRDTSNWYAARFAFNTDGTIYTGIDRMVGGVSTALSLITTTPPTFTPGEMVNIKMSVFGSTLSAKVWADGDPEPDTWKTVVTDTNLTSPGFVGTYASVGTTAAIFTVDSFQASHGFGAFELQREDDYTDWQTIMLATSPLTFSFNDFEARVGVESRYRIRVCHELDFCGAWSSEVARTITAPGVTGDDITDYVMIFTSNASQDGSSFLAYVEAFDSQPAESFTFMEASDITMQPMYNRDYRVAFHGTERGGEQFSRELLINNAAVSTIQYETAAQALRNLAWDSLPYVCVRMGNSTRWFANVAVPGIVIQPPRNASQIVGITVTEVTGTPYPVNP